MGRPNHQRPLSCSEIGVLALLAATFALGVAASSGTLAEAALTVAALAVLLALAWAWAVTARGRGRQADCAQRPQSSSTSD